MATSRLINGVWVDVDFTGTRLIEGVWVTGQPSAAPAAVTARTVMTPDGDVITFDVADQTVMSPSGSVLNANIEAAAVGGLSIPIAAYHYNHNTGSRL
jgi:hypothetical protein